MAKSLAQLKYYAWDVNHKKSVTDDGRFTSVLSESKVDMNPHQVEAALFAFKSPLNKGAILADEVGLGKTIEAGILLSEFWAECKRHILVIVPASLRNQWNMELLDKFYLPSSILEGNSFQNLKSHNSNPFNANEQIIICSYKFAVLHIEEISQVRWDLVIMDEAHKLRNVYKKDNVMGNALKKALRPYKKILLTATPLQNNLKELYGLISIIDDDFFSSVQAFDSQYNNALTNDSVKYGELKNRISHIIHRTLRRQVKEYVKYTKRIPFVQEYRPSKQELDLYKMVSNYLFREGTFGVPEQIRPLLSLTYRKIMSSSAYALSYTLKSTIARLEEMKISRRQVVKASSLSSDFDVLEHNEDCEEPVIQVKELSDDDVETINNEIIELGKYVSFAENVHDETKATELLKALSTSFDMVVDKGGSHKALIFTESRRTQEYLKSFLESNGYENKIVVFNGTNDNVEAKEIYQKWLADHEGSSLISGNPLIDKKQALVDYFRETADIMIATEAGAEGINLQFCSLVVNYDMPWNPQRIEQRIGRCHRYGQKYDVIVVNFVNMSNAADRRVYELLSTKFNLFDGIFGSSDEVLGAIDSTFDFEGKLREIFRKCRTEREINDAFDSLQMELSEVIDERMKDTKKSLLENFDEDVVNKLSVRQENDIKLVDTYRHHFWKLAIETIGNLLSHVDESKFSFVLKDTINASLQKGMSFTFDKNDDEKTLVRLISPLGNYIIAQYHNVGVPIERVSFDLSSYPFRMVVLENCECKEGWIAAYHVSTNNEYDSEETLLFAGFTENGQPLSADFARKLLELDVVSCESIESASNIEDVMRQLLNEQMEDYKKQVNERTEEYANHEIDKYESFSEDQLVPLQNEIAKLRKQKDSIHKRLRKERDVKTKLFLNKEELSLAKKIKSKQRILFDMEDKYAQDVDKMTAKLLKQLDNKFDSELYFMLNWTIV